MWLLPAPRSASIPAACVSLARRRRSSSSSGETRGPRIDRARVRLGRVLLAECLPEPGRWPGRFPSDGAPCRPGPSPGGWGSGHLRLRPSSPPSLSPRRLVMFATAWAPCLCASEARPSDRGIRCGASDPVTFVTSPSSGGRPLQRAGVSGCDNPPTRRRPRLA
jgi:hypothetical protein